MQCATRSFLVAVILLGTLVSGQHTTTTGLEEVTTQSNTGFEDVDTTTDFFTELCDQFPTTIGSTDLSTESEGNASSTLNTTEETTKNILENDVETTTPSSPDVEATTTIPPTPINCSAAGNVPHPTDCRRYYKCSQEPIDGPLQATEELCQTGLAFNIEFSSCMRDLAPCSPEHGGFHCIQAGSFPDPNNDSTLYYRCVPFLDGQVNVFHKYKVKCGSGMVYMPQLRKCFMDLNSVGSYPAFGFYGTEPSDEWLVKMELKQWKIKEKTKLKEKKMRLKYEKKLQKELAKKEAKETKEKAKAENQMKKQEVISNANENDETGD